MYLPILLSFLPYAFVTTFTPGPNTMLAFHSVGQNGWRKGSQVMLGMFCGFSCVALLCAMFCYQLSRFIPAVSGVLKYVGAAYIVWLAIHIARSKPADQQGRPARFWTGFALQFVNVKVILYAITTFSAYVLPVTTSLPYLLLTTLILVLISAGGYLTWALLGGILQRFLSKYYKPFNYATAAVLLLCALRLVL